MCKGIAVSERLTANSCASTLPPGTLAPAKYKISLNPVCQDRFFNSAGEENGR
jgi:hypothetical protein